MKRNRFPAVAVWVAAVLCLPRLRDSRPLRPSRPRGSCSTSASTRPAPTGSSADLSGQNNNGRASDAKWTSAGKQGGGCEFAPTGSHIRVPNSASLNVKQATFAAWFKTSKSNATWRPILDKRAEHGYALGIGGDAKDLPSRGKLAFAINGGTPCVSDNVVTDGAWHHAAATFDGENLRLYVDGQPQKQVIRHRAKIAANADDLIIGMNDSHRSPREKGQSFDGLIDDVMIFNRAPVGRRDQSHGRGRGPVGREAQVHQAAGGRAIEATQSPLRRRAAHQGFLRPKGQGMRSCPVTR